MFLRNKKKGFEDTRKSNQKRKSNHRQYNGQKKKDKMTNNNPQNITFVSHSQSPKRFFTRFDYMSKHDGCLTGNRNGLLLIFRDHVG
jgi:hypothetical protein